MPEAVNYGPKKRVLRRVDGKLQIIRKRKKPLPMSMRSISKAAAHRRAIKSAIKRRPTQKRTTRKVMKTQRRARRMGLMK